MMMDWLLPLCCIVCNVATMRCDPDEEVKHIQLVILHRRAFTCHHHASNMVRQMEPNSSWGHCAEPESF